MTKRESLTMQDTPELDTPSAPLPTEKSLDDRSQRSALMIVFLVMVIDLLGFGIVLPLLPRYGDQFLEPLFPGRAGLHGMILGLLMASFSAMQFLFAPIWGKISDRAGRRPFLLLGLAGSVIFYSLFGVASDLASSGRLVLGLVLLFVARIGAGIAGATVSTAQAVIADSTRPERRAVGMALIGAAFGIGFTFGPALGAGSFLLFPNSLGGPGFIAAGLSLIALLIAWFRMPETLRPGVSAGRRNWLNLSGIRLAFQTPTVPALILTFFLSTLAFASFEPTVALLAKDLLGYGIEKSFWVFVYIGAVLAFTQGGLYRMLAKRGMSEITFMVTGAVLMAVGLGIVGISASGFVQPSSVGSPTMSSELSQGAAHAVSAPAWLLILFLAASTLAVIGFAFVTPSVQALISVRSDPAKQGEILGVNQSANALSRILGPMAGAMLYFLPPAHVLPYAFAVGLLVVVLLLTLRVRQP
jgi:DHA1 family tetracycline resistance protein-like MFS transporter